MEDIKKAFAEYLKSNVKKPSDWDILGLGDFPPGFTATKKYCEHIVTNQTKMNETDLLKIPHIYNFFGYSEDEGSFKDWISTSNKTKAIENFFKKENYIPVNKTLEFIAALFDAPLNSFASFQASLQKKKHEEAIQETIAPPIIPQELKIKKSVTYLVMAIVFVMVSALAYLMYSNFILKQQNKRSNDIIGDLEFAPVVVPEDTLVVAVSNDNNYNSDAGGLAAADNDDEPTYFTNHIYNKDFILPKDDWSFDIDPKGEDINSDYGKPFSNELRPLYKDVIQDKVTIANNQMLIRLNIRNNTNTKWVIDNIYIKKVDQYTPEVKKVYKNTWSVKEGELSYGFEMNKYASIYPITTFIELKPGQAKYFSMNITGDHSCNGAIFKYKIVFSGNGSKGNSFTIESDKEYYLGFYNNR